MIATFGRETWAFLDAGARDNTKATFDAARATYRQQVVAPSAAFVEAMATLLPEHVHPDLRAEAKVVAVPDQPRHPVRQGQDPYKTYLDFVFWICDGPTLRATCPHRAAHRHRRCCSAQGRWACADPASTATESVSTAPPTAAPSRPSSRVSGRRGRACRTRTGPRHLGRTLSITPTPSCSAGTAATSPPPRTTRPASPAAASRHGARRGLRHTGISSTGSRRG